MIEKTILASCNKAIMIGIVSNTTCLPFDFMLDQVIYRKQSIVRGVTVLSSSHNLSQHQILRSDNPLIEFVHPIGRVEPLFAAENETLLHFFRISLRKENRKMEPAVAERSIICFIQL